MPKDEQTFEGSIKQLEILIKELETGDLPLDDIISKYKESTALVKFCREKLDNADKTICDLLELDPSGRQIPLSIDMKGNDTNE